MLSIQRIRDDPDSVREGARRKGETAPIDELLAVDAEARGLRTTVEQARAEQHAASSAVRGKPSDEQRASLTTLKQRIQDGEARLADLDQRVEALLLEVPNPPHASVPHGAGPEDNVVVRTWGTAPTFAFDALPHYELGERLGVFDFERAAKISGSRFAVLRGDGARLQRALTSFMLDVAREHGYTEVAPPLLVRREAMIGTAQLPKFEDEAYHADDGLFLIPTAEVPVTNLYAGEILEVAHLPIAHVALTPCWRREAGAAGKDTRGYIRLHQFEKVEMVRFTTPETSLDELELITAHAEHVLQRLDLHYRVLLMCTGDLGFAQWKKYDVEVWAPGMGHWLEVSSCSVFADFQARRANIRYRPSPGEKPRHVHTLNGSALGVPRTFDAVLETYQQEDGSVLVPEPLRAYLGGLERSDRAVINHEIDPAWLNDRSEFQQNWVHGLRNPSGLHLQYELDGNLVFTHWTPGDDHAGFPGFAHGGIISAVLDDVMGRCSALHRHWVVTGRLEVRYRRAAPLGARLRIEGRITRLLRRALHTDGRVLLPDGGVVAEATGTYLPLSHELRRQMVDAWPGFEEFL